MAETKQKDPTVRSTLVGQQSDAAKAALEGYHPTRPVSEAADAAVNASYSENSDKPDVTTVAQVEDEKKGKDRNP